MKEKSKEAENSHGFDWLRYNGLATCTPKAPDKNCHSEVYLKVFTKQTTCLNQWKVCLHLVTLHEYISQFVCSLLVGCECRNAYTAFHNNGCQPWSTYDASCWRIYNTDPKPKHSTVACHHSQSAHLSVSGLIQPRGLCQNTDIIWNNHHLIIDTSWQLDVWHCSKDKHLEALGEWDIQFIHHSRGCRLSTQQHGYRIETRKQPTIGQKPQKGKSFQQSIKYLTIKIFKFNIVK